MEIDTFANGAGENVAEEQTAGTAHIDAERGLFITSNGNALELSGKAISALMLERITNEGRPKIPRQEVTLLGKHKELQANPNDPGYLALLKEWEGEQNIRVMRYLFCVGVKGTPPDDFKDEQRQFFPDASDADMKYLWVSSLVPDTDIDTFSEALIGQYGVTTKGIEGAGNFSASK